MFTEAAFLESSADGEYVSFFMEAEDLEEAYETFEDSTHDIDHRRRVCAGTHRRRTTNTLDESVGR